MQSTLDIDGAEVAVLWSLVSAEAGYAYNLLMLPGLLASALIFTFWQESHTLTILEPSLGNAVKCAVATLLRRAETYKRTTPWGKDSSDYCVYDKFATVPAPPRTTSRQNTEFITTIVRPG